jgi:chorismate-pyruvate lyase
VLIIFRNDQQDLSVWKATLFFLQQPAAKLTVHITVQNEQRFRMRRQRLPELFSLTGAKNINFRNVLL